MSGIIQTSDLTKQYASLKAVDSVNLDIKKGEIYGFLGLNGAGKTTTIRMMLGMIKPSQGKVYLFGKEVNKSPLEIWNRVGHMVEIPYSYPELTVNENLEIFKRIRGIGNPGLKDDIISKLHLENYLHIKAKNLSLGNAQRLGIAKALIHKPELLILDEPANGLDPEGIVQIREMLKDLAEKDGVSIFISSHILGEISLIANRIGIIHEGGLIREAEIHDIHNERVRFLNINTSNNNKAKAYLEEKGYSPDISVSEELELKDIKSIENPSEITKLLVDAGFALSKVNVVEEDLEHYFLRIIHSNTTAL